MKMPAGVEYARGLLKRGVYTFTRDEARTGLGKSGPNLNAALRYLERSGWVFPLGRKFFVIIDPQHQGYGALPLEWFVDDWARSLGMEYYVGGLSAAMLHGASHQKPQVFHVVADRQMRPVARPNLEIAFFRKGKIVKGMWEEKKSAAGYFRVSTPEMTSFDLLYFPRTSASLDRVVTILVELGEAIKAEALADLANLGCEIQILQRLGWLLDRAGWANLTDGLRQSLQEKRRVWSLLQPGLPASGSRNERWRVVENVEIEPDIAR
jgi:predicted transcriptional regulator of viral defense system